MGDPSNLFVFVDKLDDMLQNLYVYISDDAVPLPDFSTSKGWETELSRLGTKYFRVADINTEFTDSQL